MTPCGNNGILQSVLVAVPRGLDKLRSLSCRKASKKGRATLTNLEDRRPRLCIAFAGHNVSNYLK